MKNTKYVLVLISGFFLFSSLYAKTAINSLKKVNTPARATVGQVPQVHSAAQQGAVEKYKSPLGESFPIKHAYPGTNVATDLVALDIHSSQGKGICTGTRFHKYWIVTAAHCFDQLFDSNTNPRIVFGVKQLANGIWQVGVTEPKTGMPTNGTLYFYRKGYISKPANSYGHAEDIALIGIDKEDKAMSLMEENIKQLDAASARMQNVSAMMAKNKAPASAHAEQAASAQASARAKMASVINDKKRFLQLPLNGYHFMTFSPESARIELAGREASGFWFEPVIKNEAVVDRKRPAEYTFTYQGINESDNHTVRWQGKEPGGMSGTPFIINGYVVGFGSGEKTTALLTDDFTAFLKRHMGADYKQGLCVRSVANEEAITERAQQ